ncbi:MAG: hypothetical protein LC800_07565 [Acidobacteria bacterium]|nr:hypothetical protein [Acidobacteriota bacterium]
MTPQDHNKVLGIMHLIYGGFFALMTILMFVITILMWLVFRSIPQDPNGPPPVFFVGFMAIFVIIYGVLSFPSLIAGYGMLKRRSWARVAALVASVLSAISFPFGTALCVYSLWFLFGDAGKAFQSSLAGAAGRGVLGRARASTYGWDAQGAEERAAEYAPPPEPPSWR